MQFGRKVDADFQRLLPAVKKVMSLFVAGEFDTLERTCGNRLSSENMRRGIAKYPATLLDPPDSHFEYVHFGKFEDERNGYWVCMPFFTEEEGRSDLEVQLSIHFLEQSVDPVITIQGILVP